VLVGGVWAADVQPIKPRHTRIMDTCEGFIALLPSPCLIVLAAQSGIPPTDVA